MPAYAAPGQRFQQGVEASQDLLLRYHHCLLVYGQRYPDGENRPLKNNAAKRFWHHVCIRFAVNLERAATVKQMFTIDRRWRPRVIRFRFIFQLAHSEGLTDANSIHLQFRSKNSVHDC
jgi:hypothetical protein